MNTGMMAGRGAGRIVRVWLACASVASCATTAPTQTNSAQSELDRESEANARASTSAGGASNASSSDAAVANYRRLAQRESSATLTERPVYVGADFQTAVLGTGNPDVSNIETGQSVTVAIGATDPLRCIVFNDIVDPANALRRVFENVRQGMARIVVEALDAGFVGESPYIEGRFVYVTRGANAGFGMLKARIALVGERSVLCMHDEVGYVETFHRAMEPIMQSGSTGPGGANYIMSLGATNLGFMAVRFREENGEIIETTINGALVARSESELTASDSVVIERYSRDGVLRKMTRANDENGTATERDWERDGTSNRYRFEGTHLGRPLQGVLTANGPLHAATPMAAAAFRTLTGPRAPASVDAQSLSLTNPLELDQDRYTLARRVDATHGWLSIQTGDRTTRALMGPAGLPDEIEFVGTRSSIRARRAGRP